MLDIKWIRANPKFLDQALLKRGVQPISKKILQLDTEKRKFITLIEQLQHAKNTKSTNISYIKDKSSNECKTIQNDINHIDQKLTELKKLKLQETIEDQLSQIMDNLPNIPASDVPYGMDESKNKLIRTIGQPKEINTPKHHYEIGKNLGMMDFDRAAKISGARFVILKHDLAKLERALINFMIDIHTTEFDFFEIAPPYLVKDHAMYNVGQLPKFIDASFQTTNGHRLVTTGEVPLTNIFANTTLLKENLPIRLVAYTPCFRSEAGSAGKDTKGMIRMHQFSKVELFSITIPEKSVEEHEYLTNVAEEILKRLELPYRVMLLCAGDMGFAAQKTYDLEVWLPAQKRYREISSCSHFGDFQARRAKSRYKEEISSKEIKFLHTLNGSGVAVGRALVAILENYQNSDGSVTIPKALVSYMGGKTSICPFKKKYIFNNYLTKFFLILIAILYISDLV